MYSKEKGPFATRTAEFPLGFTAALQISVRACIRDRIRPLPLRRAKRGHRLRGEALGNRLDVVSVAREAPTGGRRIQGDPPPEKPLQHWFDPLLGDIPS